MSRTDLFAIFLFQLQYANRPVKPRADWRAFHTMTRSLQWTGDLLPGEKCMNAARSFLAFRHGVDHFAPAVGAIAARKDLREIRLAGVRVAHHDAARIQ